MPTLPCRRRPRLGLAPAAAILAGFLAARDEGTTADYYVSPSGSDANAGTSVGAPKLTIASALSAALAAGGAKHIKLRAGTYRVEVDLRSYPNVTVSRYAAESVTISGQDLIASGSWSLADASDDTWLGAALRAQGVVYKATVPTANLPNSDPRSAFLHEGSTPLVPACARKADVLYPLHMMYEDQWLTSAVATTNPLTTYKLPASHQGLGYSAAQVQNADILFHASGNFNWRQPVLSYDPGTFTLTPNYGGSYGRSARVDARDSFELVNILPSMQAGGWGYRVDGSNTVLYVWPASTDSVANGTIGYTRRHKGIRMGSGCRVRGLRTFGHATTATTQSGAMGISAISVNDVQVDNCLVESVWNPEDGYGGIYVFTCDDAVVANCTVNRAYATLGITFTSNFPGDFAVMMTTAQRGQRNKLRLCVVDEVERSPIRWYGQDQGVVLGFRALPRCGTQAHANKIEAYIQNSRCAFVGCDFGGSLGYATDQASSNLAFLTCDMPAGKPTDGRGYDDQGSSSMPPPSEFGIGTATKYMLCCRLPPHAFGLTGASFSALMLGSSSGAVGTWIAEANISHGITVDGSGHATDHNVVTGGTTPAGTGNTSPTLASVYVDAGIGDRTYKSDAAFRSAARRDLSARVATIKSWFDDTGPGGTSGRLFTDAEFDIDAAGQAVDWAQAPFGCFNDPNANLARAPSWGAWPTIPSTYATGVAIAPTFWIDASPFPAIAYLWEKSSNGTTWTTVATTRSYTPVENPATTQLRLTVTPAGLAPRTTAVSG